MINNNIYQVTASIVTYNSESCILPCVQSILDQTKDLDFKLYISDNASTDNTVSLLTENFPGLEIMRNTENKGFGWGHNQVIRQLNDEVRYHVVINPDIQLEVNTIKHLAEHMDSNPDVSLIMPKILNMDGTEQFLPKRNPSIKYLLSGMLENKSKYFRKLRKEYTREGEQMPANTDIEFCTGSFMFFRMEHLRALGGFDERYFLHMEDADITRAMKQYGRTVYTPDTYVYHLWNRDNHRSLKGQKAIISSMMKYFAKWAGK